MNPLVMHGSWLVIVFAFLMGLAILLYVILDGYDLGVGILLHGADDSEKDQMIASIGPFWDANETWLVLGVGILLIAFPLAHGAILSALYLPTAAMLIALILRGVSFDFRAKVSATHKRWWDYSFFLGSLGAGLAQGYMLGLYVMGFAATVATQLFAVLTAVCLAAGYSFLGASWLIMKTEGQLQCKAIRWARLSLWLTALGIALVSIATPLVSINIFEKWFSFPDLLLLAPVPLATIAVIIVAELVLKKLPLPNDRFAWLPFAGAIVMFILCFLGLAYSFYPYVIPEKMTIFGAAASPESLWVVFIGAMIVLPCIIGYTIFAYRVFWGKVRDLHYY